MSISSIRITPRGGNQQLVQQHSKRSLTVLHTYIDVGSRHTDFATHNRRLPGGVKSINYVTIILEKTSSNIEMICNRSISVIMAQHWTV